MALGFGDTPANASSSCKCLRVVADRQQQKVRNQDKSNSASNRKSRLNKPLTLIGKMIKTRWEGERVLRRGMLYKHQHLQTYEIE
jgi:hypothetical protein